MDMSAPPTRDLEPVDSSETNTDARRNLNNADDAGEDAEPSKSNALAKAHSSGNPLEHPISATATTMCSGVVSEADALEFAGQFVSMIAAKDRQISGLRAELEECTGCAKEREAQHTKLEEAVAQTMQDVRHYQLSLDFHRRKLEELVKRHEELEESRKGLVSELETKGQELKHSYLDIEVEGSHS